MSFLCCCIDYQYYLFFVGYRWDPESLKRRREKSKDHRMSYQWKLNVEFLNHGSASMPPPQYKYTLHITHYPLPAHVFCLEKTSKLVAVCVCVWWELSGERWVVWNFDSLFCRCSALTLKGLVFFFHFFPLNFISFVFPPTLPFYSNNNKNLPSGFFFSFFQFLFKKTCFTFLSYIL